VLLSIYEKMPNRTTLASTTTTTTDPIVYDMGDDAYVRFLQLSDVASFIKLQTQKVTETHALVDREPPNSAFAAHWTHKARGEMEEEYAVNYVALKECEQAGVIRKEDAHAWGLDEYYRRVESMHARLGYNGAVRVSEAQKNKMEELVE
jgi:hypothetical protein